MEVNPYYRAVLKPAGLVTRDPRANERKKYGLKTMTAKEVMAKFPTRMVEKAIYGMLPHTKLGDQMRKQLYVYASAEHPHAAQKPVEFVVKA